MNYERFEKRKWEWQKSVEEIMGKKIGRRGGGLTTQTSLLALAAVAEKRLNILFLSVLSHTNLILKSENNNSGDEENLT
jgi:hypothetical protein